MPSNNPAVLGSLMPGANISGSSVGVPPSPMSMGQPSIGGGVSPFMPTSATGQSMPPMGQPSAAAPAATPTDTSGLGGANLFNLFGGGPGSGVPGDYGQSFAGLDKALRQTGIPGGIAALLAGFLQSGAGFNPQVAQALINAMGPSIMRGKEDIAEQFSAMGNRFGSPAATGLADYMSQVNLNIGQIFAGMYENAVQNYISVLMGAGKKQPTFWGTAGQAFAGQAGSNLANFLVPGGR